MSPVVGPASRFWLACVGLAFALLAGCNSGTAPALGPDEDPDALPAQMGQLNSTSTPNSTPNSPRTPIASPLRTPTVDSTPPGPGSPKRWTPGDPGVKELTKLSVIINIDPNSSFDQLSEQFAQARADKKVLPSGKCELERLYDAALRAPFRGKFNAENRIEFFKEWQAAKPEDPAPLILLAKMHHAIGWNARGGGGAAGVSQENFKIFHDELTKGLEFAQQAEKLTTPDPELFAILVGLGQGLSVKKKHFDTWVEAGSKIQPNYFTLYESAAFNLLPRWHGEPGDVEKLAEDLHARIGGDDGLEAYARVAMSVMPFDRDILFAGQFDMKKVVAGAEVMGRRYPQETSILPFLTVMAWTDQNQPLARKYVERYVKAGKPPAQLMDPYYQQIYGFCESELPPDKPETLHWPYMNCAQKLVYIDGGRGFITLPTAKWETVRFWDRDNLRGPRGALPEFNEKVAGLKSDDAGKRLILSIGSAVSSTDISIALDQEVEPVIFQGPGQRLGTALSPDGKYAATCRGEKIIVWDPATGQTHLDLAGTFEHAIMRFSPDSQRLLVVARGSMELFDPSNGNLLYKYSPSKGSANLSRVEHFIDGKTLLGYGYSTSGGAALCKWFPDEQKVVELNREGGSRYVTLDDVSRNYVLCSEVGRLGPIYHLFRLSDGKKMRTVEGHQTRVASAVISPNETEFATIDLSGPIKFWQITP